MGKRLMTFTNFVREVLNQPFGTRYTLRVDLGDGSPYKQVESVVVANKGFVIIKVKKEVGDGRDE